MKNARLTLLFFALVCPRGFGALLVDDTFDGYLTQSEFEAVWTPIGTVNPISGVHSTSQAVSAPYSIEYPSTGTSGRYHNQLAFDPTPKLSIGDQLIWSFDYYDRTPIGAPQANYASLQTAAMPGSSPAGQRISLGLNNNQLAGDSGGNRYMASIQGYSHAAVDPDGGPNEAAPGTASGAFFKLNDTGAGLRGSDAAWHKLMVILTTSDGTNVDHAYYVDGTLAETVTNVGPVVQYSVIRLGSGLARGVAVNFDNMKLEFVAAAVPEAGSFAAVGLVGLLSAGGVWLRRRAGKAA